MDKFQKALALISVDNEPGLSTTQRMLVNEDLKPGMSEHRRPPLFFCMDVDCCCHS